MYALQLIEDFGTEADALQAMDSLRAQDGFIGGRVLAPSNMRTAHRVQAFFADEGEVSWLPDGVRRVILLAGQLRSLGIGAMRN